MISHPEENREPSVDPTSISPDERMVSVLSHGYLDRAVDLWQMLVWILPTAGVSVPGAVRVAPAESSYAASICILALMGLDGSLARCQHFLPTRLPRKTREPWANRVLELDPSMPPPLIAALEELTILRDTLAHNHLWEVGFQWGNGQEDSMLQTSLTPDFGNSKHPAYTDRVSHFTTGPLQLELIPTQLTREEALMVFGVIWAVLHRLESTLGNGLVAISDFWVDVRPDRFGPRDTVLFRDWLTSNLRLYGGKALPRLMTLGCLGEPGAFP